MKLDKLSCEVSWEYVKKDTDCYVSPAVPNSCGGKTIKAGEIALLLHTMGPSRFWCQGCAEKILHIVPDYTSLDSETSEMGQTKKYSKNPKTEVCLWCKQAMCEVCHVCENPECKLVGKRVVTEDQLNSVKGLLAETQKIRGVILLNQMGMLVPKPFRVVLKEEDIETISVLSPYTPKVFVRPCPIRPRHGFVESRFVDAAHKEAIKKIWHEARAQDPKSELLIMPPINAVYNVVLTPSMLTIGPGHDGATNGKNCLNVPLTGVSFWELPPKMLSRAGINPSEEDPYIEVVTTNSACGEYYTQLRAGTKLNGTWGDDFIPYNVTVKNVVKAEGDLLEWEELVKTLEIGTVVDHECGSLVSHFGHHCICAGVPVITSHTPKIGEVLVANGKLVLPDFEAFKRGLAVGVYSSVLPLNQRASTQLMLTIAHNAVAMGGKHGYWLGIATAIMLRIGMAASHGEARHATWGEDPIAGKPTREKVYRNIFNDFWSAREKIGNILWLFNHHSWSSSFGGKAWGKCTESLIALEEAVRKFLMNSSDEGMKDIILKLHQTLNQAHNSGWWLNKFIGAESLNAAAKQSFRFIASSANMFMVWQDAMEEYGEKCVNDSNFMSWSKMGDIEESKPISYFTEDDNKDDEIDEESSEDGEDEDEESGCDCPDCNPPTQSELEPNKVVTKVITIGTNLDNVNIPLESTDIIYYAQGRFLKGDTLMHVQFRVNDKVGYYSRDLSVMEIPTKEIDLACCNCPSMANSEAEYFPLVINDGDDPGIIIFTEPTNGVKLMLDMNLGAEHNIPKPKSSLSDAISMLNLSELILNYKDWKYTSNGKVEIKSEEPPVDLSKCWDDIPF